MQRFLGALAVAHFLFQFVGSFIHTPFQVLPRAAQFGVTNLNLGQHFIEAVDQYANLVFGFLSSADGIIPASGNHLGSPRQSQNRVRNGTLQALRHRIGPQGNSHHNQPEKEEVAFQQLVVFDGISFEKYVSDVFSLQSDLLKDQHPIGSKPAGFVFNGWRSIDSFGCRLVIDRERFSIRVIDDSRQDVRLGRERMKNVPSGLLVLEYQRRRAVGRDNVGQRVQVLQLHLLEAEHPVFGEGNAGHAQSRKRVEHDHVGDLVAKRKFTGPLHVSCSRPVPLP